MTTQKATIVTTLHLTEKDLTKSAGDLFPPKLDWFRREHSDAVRNADKVIFSRADGRGWVIKDRDGIQNCCAHLRTLFVSGKCSDMCSTTWPDGSRSDGYAQYIEGLGGGDSIHVEVCIDCQVVVGLASAERILAVQAEEQGED